MEVAKDFTEKHKDTLNSLRPVFVIAAIINVLFFLQMYYSDSMIGFIFFNLLIFGAFGVFWVMKLVIYIKDREKLMRATQFPSGSPDSSKPKTLTYMVTLQMKSWTYYLNPDNLSYLVQFYIGSQVIGLLLRWCSSLGFVVVTINGYLVKKVLKQKYGMSLGDLKTKVVEQIKRLTYLVPRYTRKEGVKTE